MRRVVEYKQYAKDFRALAAGTAQLDDKTILEEIATARDKIAALREQDLEHAKETLAAEYDATAAANKLN